MGDSEGKNQRQGRPHKLVNGKSMMNSNTILLDDTSTTECI